jgi:ATP-dependent Lon protease
MTQNSNPKETPNKILDVLYDYMINKDYDQSKSDFGNFLTSQFSEAELEKDFKAITDEHSLFFVDNLILVIKKYKKDFINSTSSRFIGLINLTGKLEAVAYMKILTNYLTTSFVLEHRDIIFDMFMTEANYINFKNFVEQQPLKDVDNLKTFIKSLDASCLTGTISYYYKELYTDCITLLKESNETQVGNLKNKPVILPTLKKVENKEAVVISSIDFKSITDPYYLLKLTLSTEDINEKDFYNNIKNIDYSVIYKHEYVSLLVKSFSYLDNKSLEYLLSLNHFTLNWSSIILIMLNSVESNEDLSKKINLILQHVGIDFCYTPAFSYSNSIHSIFEQICHSDRLVVWDTFKQHGVDINNIPNINHFLKFSLYDFESNKAIEIFNLLSDYIIADNSLVYSLCYNVISEYAADCLSVNDFEEINVLLRSKNIDVFSVLNNIEEPLIYEAIEKFSHVNLTNLLSCFFTYKSPDMEWQTPNDSIGNNFVHRLLHSLKFIDLAPHLIKYKELLELFFKPDFNGRRPVDFVMTTNKIDAYYVLSILNIIIKPTDSLYSEFEILRDKWATTYPTYIDMRTDIKNNKDKSLVAIIAALDLHFPVVDDFVLYDVYTKEAVASFETYVSEMLQHDSPVVPWVNKLKTTSGTKKLIFSTQIKKNLETLRKTFPNFKEFIDHVENYIYLNDMGEGYFWIPASLLVSAPGIGKTFFLHSLSKAVGVSYDMISMESVTAGFVLVGSSQQWSHGQPGEVFQKVFKSDYANNILILDEVDKSTNSNYPVDTVLLPLLETHTAKKFKDEFVNIPLDISKMIWVATANNIDNISDPIKSRFKIFNIPSPNFEERMILTQAIYLTLLDDNAWGAKFEKSISHDVLVELSKDRNSSRDLRKTILDACGRAAKRVDNKLIISDLNILETHKHISEWDKKHD